MQPPSLLDAFAKHVGFGRPDLRSDVSSVDALYRGACSHAAAENDAAIGALLLAQIAPGTPTRGVLIEAPVGSLSAVLAGTAKLLPHRTQGPSWVCIQGRPDLLPSELIDPSYPDGPERTVQIKGPLFSGAATVHVDELDRMSSIAQEVLLEALTGQVTVAGHRRLLQPLFLVCSIRRPGNIDSGVVVRPLPEALLDRLMLCVPLAAKRCGGALPTGGAIKARRMQGAPAPLSDFSDVRKSIANVHVSPSIYRLIASITLATGPATNEHSCTQRNCMVGDSDLRRAISEAVRTGAGVRAGIDLLALARAAAWYRSCDNRCSVTRVDVKVVAPFVLAHRIDFRQTHASIADRVVFIHDMVQRLSRQEQEDKR